MEKNFFINYATMRYWVNDKD